MKGQNIWCVGSFTYVKQAVAEGQHRMVLQVLLGILLTIIHLKLLCCNSCPVLGFGIMCLQPLVSDLAVSFLLAVSKTCNKRTEKKYLMQKLIICALHLILALQLNQRGCDGWMCGRIEVVRKHTKFWSASHKECGHKGDLGIHVRIIQNASYGNSLCRGD